MSRFFLNLLSPITGVSYAPVSGDQLMSWVLKQRDRRWAWIRRWTG